MREWGNRGRGGEGKRGREERGEQVRGKEFNLLSPHLPRACLSLGPTEKRRSRRFQTTRLPSCLWRSFLQLSIALHCTLAGPSPLLRSVPHFAIFALLHFNSLLSQSIMDV